MLIKNTLGVKKCKANQKQHVSRQVQPKALISAEAKKLAILYTKTFNSLNDIQYIFHNWLCHLVTCLYYKGGQVTKPIVKNIPAIKPLYVIQGVIKVF